MSAARKIVAAPRPVRVGIVDRDRVLAASLRTRLRAEGFEADTIESLDAADAPDVLLLETSGRATESAVHDLRRRWPSTAVIAMTSFGSIDDAVRTTRAGAFDYLVKPIADDVVADAIARAAKQLSLRRDAPLPQAGKLDDLIGTDPQMLRVFELAEAVAGSRSTVLIVGESGTGKSLLARAIHARSPRKDKPFVELSCGALPETLLESELFGHVKGSFTGAIADKPGRFCAADGGTIFLDEINSASPAMQAKLLRVLQEKTYEPVGSSTPKAVDARTILATNADLRSLVDAGAFRQDLFWRINVVPIELPPLRRRKADILRLAESFLRRRCVEGGREILGFTPVANERLLKHDWPDNVRELENAIERAVLLTKRPWIDASDLPEPRVSPTTTARPFDEHPPMALAEAMKLPERAILLAALRRHAFHRGDTAAELHIDRTTLYKKMRAHGLDGPGVE